MRKRRREQEPAERKAFVRRRRTCEGTGMPCQDVEVKPGWSALTQGAVLGYWPAQFEEKAAELLAWFLKEVDWLQCDLRIMGKVVPQPRLVAYYASDASLAYSYSGLKLQPVPIPPELATLWSSVEHLAGAQFNSLLMNHYRDGSDCVGWHADNEKLYGPNPTIASLSFGQPRRPPPPMAPASISPSATSSPQGRGAPSPRSRAQCPACPCSLPPPLGPCSRTWVRPRIRCWRGCQRGWLSCRPAWQRPGRMGRPASLWGVGQGGPNRCR
ncbi:hypothetical protein V8C86DRAFT_454724 [Haematococcus lacustris]